MQEGIYVTHWEGEFDGREIRSLTISTGYRSMKLNFDSKISMNRIVEEFGLKEGDKIKFAYRLEPTKAEGHRAIVTKLEKVEQK